MIDTDYYLENKQAQIFRWTGEVARLDALCRDAGDYIRKEYESHLEEFSQNLDDLNIMFCEFQRLNECGREKFRHIVEKIWSELEDSFNHSISEYEELILELWGK